MLSTSKEEKKWQERGLAVAKKEDNLDRQKYCLGSDRFEALDDCLDRIPGSGLFS